MSPVDWMVLVPLLVGEAVCRGMYRASCWMKRFSIDHNPYYTSSTLRRYRQFRRTGRNWG